MTQQEILNALIKGIANAADVNSSWYRLTVALRIYFTAGGEMNEKIEDETIEAAGYIRDWKDTIKFDFDESDAGAAFLIYCKQPVTIDENFFQFFSDADEYDEGSSFLLNFLKLQCRGNHLGFPKSPYSLQKV